MAWAVLGSPGQRPRHLGTTGRLRPLAYHSTLNLPMRHSRQTEPLVGHNAEALSAKSIDFDSVIPETTSVVVGLECLSHRY